MARSRNGEENRGPGSVEGAETRTSSDTPPSEEAIVAAARDLAGGTTADAPDGASAYGIASGDENDAARVAAQTTTRERQARAKRAHEPLVPTGEPLLEEDVNGPRLPEVHGAEAARVLDPATDTSSLEYPPADEGENTSA